MDLGSNANVGLSLNAPAALAGCDREMAESRSPSHHQANRGAPKGSVLEYTERERTVVVPIREEKGS